LATRLTEEVNELPPFPISPLDDGKPPSRVPVASARVEIEGENWLLRPCNGLLFARRESRNEADWTFAASEPLADDDVSAKRLGELWGHALANQKIARFVVFYARQISRDVPLFFAEGGVGWMREFCNRDDFPFEWNVGGEKKGVLVRPVSEFLDLGKGVFNESLWWPLYNWDKNHPAEPIYVHEDLHFLYGSQKELERLCHLICWGDGLMALSQTLIRAYFSSDNGFTRARLRVLRIGELDFWNDYSRDEEATNGQPKWYSEAPPSHIMRLFNLALEENTPAGLEWEHAGRYSGRASCVPESLEIHVEFPPPSMHEHLEARLQLREWLASRVSPEELEELLS